MSALEDVRNAASMLVSITNTLQVLQTEVSSAAAMLASAGHDLEPAPSAEDPESPEAPSEPPA